MGWEALEQWGGGADAADYIDHLATLTARRLSARPVPSQADAQDAARQPGGG